MHLRPVEQLGSPEHELADAPLESRDLTEQEPLDGPDGMVKLGHEPRSAPLDDREMSRHFSHRRHELHGAGTGADGDHALAGEVDIVVPAHGVPLVPGEGVAPWDVRDERPVEGAQSRDHELGADRGAISGGEAPAVRCLVEGSLDDVGAEPDVGPQGVAVDHGVGVRV